MGLRRCSMDQTIEYEYHRYICPPKDGKTLYVFKYLNPLNGQMVAHLVAKVYDNETYNEIYLDELYVEPYARRQHLASKLMEEAIKLKTNQPIYLDCYTDNYPALSLYMKFGFEIDEEYEFNDETLYRMIKRN